MRKGFAFICMILMGLSLCGCVSKNPEDNNLDAYMFNPYLKPNIMAEDGKKVALSDDRIWYLSAESGQQGLHSMAADGSDVRLEFQTEDIRSIAMRNGCIWTAEFVGMDKNHCGEFRLFQPFLRQRGNLYARKNLLSGIDVSLITNYETDDTNLFDLYPIADDVLLMRFTYPHLPTGGLSLSSSYLRIGDTKFIRTSELVELSEYDRPDDFRSYIMNDVFTLGYRGNCVFCDYEAYDVIREQQVLPSDVRHWKNGWLFYNLVYARGKNFYFTDRQSMWRISVDPVKARIITRFEKDERIYASYHTDDTHLLLTWKDVEKRRSDKCLYRIELQSGAKTRMLSTGKKAEFVYLNETYTAVAEDKTLTLYDISGAEAKEVRQIELSHEIADKANKTDCAGGWWFLYRFNEETNRDELIEKVRLY